MEHLVRCALVIASIATLAGCGKQSNAMPSGLLNPGSAGTARAHRAVEHDLLYTAPYYASRGFIYSYPQGEHRRPLSRSDIGWVLGGCADSSGNVYLISLYSSGGESVYVYPHGGEAPTRHIVDHWGSACSSDPVTGDLALGSTGKVAILHAASGKPKIYVTPDTFFGKSTTFDGSGNLFVAGYTTGDKSASRPALLELPKSGAAFVPIRLPALNSPSGSLAVLRWDGKYLAAGNGANTVYRLAVVGMRARVAGAVQLDGLNHVTSMWIEGNTIVAGGDPDRSALIWYYPFGGDPIKIVNGAGNEAIVIVSTPAT